MRKSVFILLTVFTACLLCKESENMPGTSRKFMDGMPCTEGTGRKK